MSTETKDQQIRKAAISSGIILGIASTILTVFSFYFTTGMTTNFWLIIGSPLIFAILLPIVVASFITRDLRKKIGGFWNFRQATSGIFIMFVISAIISSLFYSLVFSKIIEPQSVEKSKVATGNAVTAMMEKANASQSDIDKAVDDINKKFDEQADITFGKILMNIGISLIVWFIVSLIFAAIFKKDPPAYIDADNYSPPQPSV
ncbi:DUF4199 domain-containing protein [Mucilaginibacter defluvii]|uniref:DUF4199 domain-containing protein n=1 Tax=Mucilaginibacter defluvii TaxID=1196019 RepID=A0ABP9FMZ8_9SPHI